MLDSTAKKRVGTPFGTGGYPSAGEHANRKNVGGSPHPLGEGIRPPCKKMHGGNPAQPDDSKTPDGLELFSLLGE
jgi:hypothetical protein